MRGIEGGSASRGGEATQQEAAQPCPVQRGVSLQLPPLHPSVPPPLMMTICRCWPVEGWPVEGWQGEGWEGQEGSHLALLLQGTLCMCHTCSQSRATSSIGMRVGSATAHNKGVWPRRGDRQNSSSAPGRTCMMGSSGPSFPTCLLTTTTRTTPREQLHRQGWRRWWRLCSSSKQGAW